MKWLICVPAWGKRCVDLFSSVALDSHADAMLGVDGEFRYLCHTDERARLEAIIDAKTARKGIFPALPKTEGYARFSSCSADAINYAQPGEVIVFLNADMVISRETFTAIEKRIKEGKKAIYCAGTRTLQGAQPPKHARSRDLLKWTMDNAHQITRDNFYGSGCSRLNSVVYFKDGDTVCMRGFHLHPIAMVNDRKLNFTSTIDWDIGLNYTEDEIHVVTDKDEFSTAEISPAEKTLTLGNTPFTASDVKDWASRRTLPFHWWLFNHRIQITGDGDAGDEAMIEAMSKIVVLYADRQRMAPLIIRKRAVQ